MTRRKGESAASLKEKKMNQNDRTKWILVMDDDEVIRAVMSAMLEQAGYKVSLTENGDEAIECYEEAKKYGYAFDAVIIDLNIPRGRDGKGTIKKLIEIDPQVKAIVMSGAFKDPAITDFKRYGFKSALIKPFSSSDLEKTMCSVLDGQG